MARPSSGSSVEPPQLVGKRVLRGQMVAENKDRTRRRASRRASMRAERKGSPSKGSFSGVETRLSKLLCAQDWLVNLIGVESLPDEALRTSP